MGDILRLLLNGDSKVFKEAVRVRVHDELVGEGGLFHKWQQPAVVGNLEG